MRDEATRKAIAMCAQWTASNTKIQVTNGTNSGVLLDLDAPSVVGNCGGQVIGAIDTSVSGVWTVNDATYNDITYETPLPWSEISKDSTTFFGDFTPVQTEQAGKLVTVRDWFNYSTQLNHEGNPVSEVLLQLNGHDRFEAQDGNYFNYVQPWEAHSATPSDGVNVYSFALNPEDHQPSGTCNFSRIDNATLNLTVGSPVDTGANQATLNVYAVNYNVLRVMSGMGGLAYSN